MKTHDSLGRKLRDQNQRDDDVKVTITERDIVWFSFMHRHGGRLPTSYIHDWTGPTHPNYQSTQNRLKLLARAGYLTRPDAQFETSHPEYNELIHELTDKADALLKSQGLYFARAPRMGGWFKHQVFLSCVLASIELNCREAGYGFIPQHVLLDRAGVGLAMMIDGDKVEDDGLCAIVIDGKEIYLPIEIDRGTHRTWSQKLDAKSWKRSVKQKREIIGSKKYKEHLKTESGALQLIVTISQAKQEGILEVIAEEMPKGCNYLLVTYIPEFGRVFHPPRKLDILGMLWLRHNHNAFRFVAGDN